MAAFARVRVGLPWDRETQMGAQVNERQLQKILAYVEVGRAEGAKVAYGGSRLTDGELGRGCFMAAAIREAGLSPSDIAHINAHATSTGLGDACETVAIKSMLGEHARNVPITANKSMSGSRTAGPRRVRKPKAAK